MRIAPYTRVRADRIDEGLFGVRFVNSESPRRHDPNAEHPSRGAAHREAPFVG